MSFKPRVSVTGYFFSAYRNTSLTISSDNTKIGLSTGNDCSISSGSIVTSSRPVYAVGEVQVSSTGNYQLGDIKINENTAAKAEGYQIRNNASGIIVMDDACYGITSGPFCSLYVDNLYAGRIESDPYQCRVMGVYTL